MGALSFASGDNSANARTAASNASAIVAVVIGAVVLVSALLVVGLAFRRAWAREASMVIYGFLGLVAAAASLGGLSADPPAPSAWLGLFTGVVNFAVVGLLIVPATARDFSGHPRNRVTSSR